MRYLPSQCGRASDCPARGRAVEGGRCDVAFAAGLLRPGWAGCDAVFAAGLAQPAIVGAKEGWEAPTRIEVRSRRVNPRRGLAGELVSCSALSTVKVSEWRALQRVGPGCAPCH